MKDHRKELTDRIAALELDQLGLLIKVAALSNTIALAAKSPAERMAIEAIYASAALVQVKTVALKMAKGDAQQAEQIEKLIADYARHSFAWPTQ